MIITDKRIIEAYRRNNNKDMFCIGDKVKYQNKSNEEFWYVVEVDNLGVVLRYFDISMNIVIRENFPNINLKMIKKCEKYPSEIIDKFSPELNCEESFVLIEWLEKDCEKSKFDFYEAMEKLFNGYKVRNTNWKKDYYIFIDKDDLLTDCYGLAYEINIESFSDLRYFLEWNKGEWEVVEC